MLCVCACVDEPNERQKKAIRKIVALTLDFIFRLIVCSHSICYWTVCFASFFLSRFDDFPRVAAFLIAERKPLSEHVSTWFSHSRYFSVLSLEMLKIAFCLFHAERFFISQILFSLIARIATNSMSLSAGIIYCSKWYIQSNKHTRAHTNTHSLTQRA